MRPIPVTDGLLAHARSMVPAPERGEVKLPGRQAALRRAGFTLLARTNPVAVALEPDRPALAGHGGAEVCTVDATSRPQCGLIGRFKRSTPLDHGAWRLDRAAVRAGGFADDVRG